jgi:hypothetical protein
MCHCQMQRSSRAAPPVSFGAARSRQNNCSRLTLMDVTSCAFPLHSFPHFYLLSFSLSLLIRPSQLSPTSLGSSPKVAVIDRFLSASSRNHFLGAVIFDDSATDRRHKLSIRCPPSGDSHVTGPVFHIFQQKVLIYIEGQRCRIYFSMGQSMMQCLIVDIHFDQD